MSTLVTTARMTMSNELRMKRNTPSTMIEIATVPIAVRAMAALRVKFWATSAQKKRTLPQSNVVTASLFVVGDTAMHQAHNAAAHAVDARLVVRGDDDRGPLRVDAREQRHDLARRLGVEVAGRFVAQQDERVVDERPRDSGALLF